MPMPSESNLPATPLPGKKIRVIFGGSFDPVHVGHTAMLRAAIASVQAVAAIVLPAYQSPHKAHHPSADARHRLAMLKLAFAGMPEVEISELEIRAAHAVYTFDSIQILRAAYPDDHLALLIGMDQLRALHRWYRAADVLKAVRLLVMPRISSVDDSEFWRELAPHWPGQSLQIFRAAILAAPAITVSSTDIRRRVANGQSIAGLVQPYVERYIFTHRLYRAGP